MFYASRDISLIFLMSQLFQLDARFSPDEGGRRPRPLPQQRTEILTMLAAGRPSTEIAHLFRVHRPTISRIAAETGATFTNASAVL